jgi:predicted dehydrogenase
MAESKIDVSPLVSHRYRFEDAEKAYSLIAENKEAYIGIVLNYEPETGDTPDSGIETARKTIELKNRNKISFDGCKPTVGLIGAGDFTARVILPVLKKTGVRLKTIASSGGVSGTHLGKKFGFEESTTDSEIIFSDPDINTVFITTRHNSHFRFVLEALNAGKHVFVEKPLCLSIGELDKICDAHKSFGSKVILVGFNRRFAPHIQKMKSLITAVHEPKAMIMTVNAGMIPIDHWTQDPAVGGGRIIGEVCHFIDLLRFLAGREIVSYEKTNLKSGTRDTLSIQLGFADGSIGTVHYYSVGNKGFPKERLEIFCAGRILQMDNFRKLRGYGWPNFKKMNLFSQNKGHEEEVKQFIDSIKDGKSAPIPFEEIVETTRVSLNLASD